MATEYNEEERLRSTALQNAQSILHARQRAEEEIVRAKEALELKTQELAHSLAMMRATLESTTDGILVTDGSGKIAAFNENFLQMWRISRQLVDAGDHRQMLKVTSQYFQEPRQFLARIDDIYTSSPPESYDLLELADGRVFERFSRIQFVEEQEVGRIWSFRDITEHIRAQAALAEQSERLRVTLASIGDAVITTDTQGRVAFLNGVAASLTGWRQSEAAGQPLELVFHIVNEKTRQPVANPALRALQEGVVVGLANHTILITKDGTERPIDDSAAPIRDEQGKLAGCVLIFRDVSQQRQAVRALEQSEARKQAILDTALDCIITCDHEGKIIEFNPAAERTFGHRREDVLGQEMSDIVIPPALRQRHQHGMARFMKTRQSRILGQRLVMTALRADGSEFPVEFAVTQISTDGLPVFTAYLRDITERKRAERDLQERAALSAFQAELGLVLTHSDTVENMLARCAEVLVRHLDGAFARVWTLNEQENVLELQASAGLYTHLDGPHSRVPVGQYKIGLIAQQRQPTLTNRVVGDTRIHDQEWALREGMIAFAGYPLLVENRLVGVVAMFARHEMSEAALQALGSVASSIAIAIEQKRQANELRKIAADLSEADRRKNEFLAMLAHELRNPLAPLRNALQIMRLSEDTGETVKWASGIMERQIAQMVRLVDDLLDLSRISQGRIELRRERVELAQLIHQAIETCRPAVDLARHELTVMLPPQPVYLHADPVRLTQVFGNLLNNSCKYSEPGSRISLTAAQQDGEMLVSVKDTGVGIPPDMLPKIFEMFTQVDRSSERAQGGLGIGLSLVQRLVELHGGSVSAFSAGPGRGSEFIVRLPLIEELKQPPSEPTAGEPAVTPARRFLVVDDNRDSAASMAMWLKLSGHQTHTAYDGHEAVEAAATFQPDVVLLDIGLPKLNGYEAARQIRQQRWGKSMVLVALTGWGQEEDRRQSREAGFNGHLVKPVDFDDLLKLLAEIEASAPPAGNVS